MGPCVMDWAALVVREKGLADWATLEVGSYDVNGTVRVLFTGPYVGVDIQPGPNVDKLMDAENLRFPSGTFRVVVSTEMLEHCLRPWKAISEMARVCAPGGYVLLTARGYDERGTGAVHEHPVDLWRFSCGSLALMMADAGLVEVEVERDPGEPGVFGVGRKP